MRAFSEYFEQAQFSQAAYAKFLQKGWFGGGTEQYPSLYAEALIKGGMSKSQAIAFANTYTVIDQYNDPSGLSVTLFKDAGGKQTVAIRGTTPSDVFDLATDVIDIAILGSAEYQLQYQALSAKVQEWKLNGDLHSGFTVTGHSLGGFQAQALATEYDSDVSAAYTYNAPGFSVGGGVTNIGTEFLDIFGLVDASIPNDKIFNIRALEGVSATAGLGQMFGSIQVVSIENQAPYLWANHYMVPLVDSLAVYHLFAQVDSSLSLNEMTGVIQASAEKADSKLESAVSALGNLLVSGFVPRTGSEYDTSHNDLYTDIETITNALENISGLSIEVLATTDAEGQSTPFSLSDIETQARTDIAYRYALVNLNSFAVVGSDAIYSRFNQNGELDIYNPSAGEGQLTDMYLTYRSEMLSLLIEKNIHDYSESTIYFEDKATGEIVFRPELNAPLERTVVFGSEQGEELVGTGPTEDRPNQLDRDDFLFGMGGAMCFILS